MKLRFGPDDEDEFAATKTALIDEFRPWTADRYGADDGSLVADAETFLDWRWNYSNGELDTLDTRDAEEFLLGWAPRKFAVGPEEAPVLCRSVQAMVEFLAATDRLAGGFATAARVMTDVDDMVDEVADVLGDPSNFGMGKSMMGIDLRGSDGSPLADLGALLGSGGVDSIDDLQALLDQRMKAFNALPFDERKVRTDPMFEGPPADPIELPIVFVPPSEAAVEASALESELLGQVDGLLRHLGTDGLKLTQAGTLRLADARKLVEVLATGDEFDPVLWGSPAKTRTSLQLLWLSFVTMVAEHAGAVEWLKTKVNANPDWLEMSVVDRAAAVVDAAFEVGPISWYRNESPYRTIAEFVEDGVPHWSGILLLPESAIRYDDIVEQVQAAALVGLEVGRWTAGDRLDTVERDTGRLLQALERVGVIRWSDRVERDDEWTLRTHYEGGSVGLTDLGRYVMPDLVREVGYTFTEIDDLSAADASALVDAVMTMAIEVEDGLAQWRPDLSTAERARLLVQVGIAADMAEQRLVVFALLRALEPAADTGLAVREALDTPLSGHAAMYLIDRGLASPDEVGMFVDVGPLVDMLATVIDQPEDLDQLFTNVQAEAIDDLLEDMWRHDQPETIEVLEALGRSLSDKKMAKAARKAVLQHRSWLANQGRR